MRAFWLAALLAALSPTASAAVLVRGDPRVELAALVQRLSGDDSLGPLAPGGRAGAELDHFKALRSHRVIGKLRALRALGFTGAFPTQYALYLSSPPFLVEVSSVPALFVEAAGGRASLDGLREDLADFAAASRFSDYWVQQAEARAALERAASASLAARDPEDDLRRYLGFRSWADWVLVPSALLPTGGPSAWVLEEKPGLPDVFVLSGPDAWHEGKPDFGVPHQAASTVWSEAVFSAVYALYELCPQPPAAAALCAAPGQPASTAQACVQGLWVDAVVGRLVARGFGEAARKEFLSSAPGGKALDAVGASLSAYESGRERYATLFDYLPQLAAALAVGPEAPRCRPVEWSRLNGKNHYARYLRLYLDASLEAHPSAQLHKDRAQLDAFLGDLEAAQADTRAALALSPSDVEAYDHLGVIFFRQGRLDEAHRAFDKALALGDAVGGIDASLHADILSSRATLLAAIQDAPGARRDLAKALRVAPADWPRRVETQRTLDQLARGAEKAEP